MTKQRRVPATTNLARNKQPPRVAYKAREVSSMLGIDVSSVYDLIRAGLLRSKRLAGGTIIVPAAALDEYLGNNDAA